MRSMLRGMLAALFGTLVVLGAAAPASAEAGDRITNFAIDYTIRPDGSVDVVESIAYQFASSGRHGIFRELITRQPFGDGSERDVRYGISDIDVQSNDAPDDVEKSKHSKGFRHEWIELQIGDPDETISGDRASYRISYRLTGALRTVNGVPELYWNATGLGWDAAIDRVEVRVAAPEGVVAADCYQGAAGSTQTCQAEAGREGATFTAAGLAARQGVTISATVPAGSVRNAEPDVVPAGTFAGQAHLGPATIGVSVLAVLLTAAGAIGMHRANRDRRYAGVPPGVIEPSAPVVIDDIERDAIPVRFNPPDLPPAVGGRLLSPGTVSRASAATLIELANHGVLTINATPQPGKEFAKTDGLQRTAVLADLSKAPADYRRAFAQDLLEPGGEIVLDQPDTDQAQRFQKASSALSKAVGTQVESFRAQAGPPRSGLLAGLAALVVVIGLIIVISQTAPAGAIYLVPGVLVVGGLLFVLARRSVGYRTPQGRALTDQVVGFRRYIETAEAGQLRFEEGQDIFSAYLPWAIMFDLADRWQAVCAELAAAGRIPAAPIWYSGPAFYDTYSAGSSFGDSLNTSTTSNSSSSGSSGGGSSGGGGGGGGGGSW